MQKTITALKVQKRNPNRVNIFLDGEFAFGLYAINCGKLRVGQELPQEIIEKLVYEDQIEDGFQKSLRYLSFKPRTEYEVIKKLKENKFSEDHIQAILQLLIEKGYVDDFQFAKNWIENRSINKPRSKKLISWELRNKKINEDIINELSNEMLPEEKLASLAADKYARRLSGYDEEIFSKKLSGYLLRRGFSYSIVNPLVEKIWKNLSQQTNENLN